MTNSIGDLAEADTIFVIGSNTTEAHPVLSLEIIRAKREGKKLIVADPRRIDLARRADIHLQIRPGTNVALLNGMMRHILDSGLEDRDFIAERTEGYDEFVESVRALTVEQAASICGVEADDIRKASELYARAGAANIIYAMGITQHHTGTNNVLTVANLAMLTGNMGRPGTGVNPLRGQVNVQGACDMGALPNVFSGYQKVDDPASIKKMEEAWGVTLDDRSPGQTVVEMMNGAGEGTIRAMYIMGENPVLSDPDQEHVESSLKKVEFLVVQDVFRTETGLQWPCPTVDHPGTSILHVGEFARGKGKLSAIEYIEPAESVDQEYQFVLTTGRELVHYHTGTLSRRAPGLDALVPEGRLEINPDDAARLGIEEGSRVRVTSRRGSMEPLAWVTDRVAPGLVFMPLHYWEAPANRLTNAVLDPVAKIPEYEVAAVKRQACLLYR